MGLNIESRSGVERKEGRKEGHNKNGRERATGKFNLNAQAGRDGHRIELTHG